MQKILILFAHPKFEQSRVNKALVQHIKDQEGVSFFDLYEAYPDFHIDVAHQQHLLLTHDVIIWQHPFYWYSCPPLMKQWIDMVLEFNWAYGPKGKVLAGKKCLQVVTTGGSQKVYCSEGKNMYTINEFLRPFEQTARLCEMNYLTPFAIMGTHQLQSSDLTEYARQYQQIIHCLRQEKPLADIKQCIFQTDIPKLDNTPT